jgi:hypothetical protein
MRSCDEGLGRLKRKPGHGYTFGIGYLALFVAAYGSEVLQIHQKKKHQTMAMAPCDAGASFKFFTDICIASGSKFCLPSGETTVLL